MKKYLLLLSTVVILGCNPDKIPDSPKSTSYELQEEKFMEVSFIFGSEHQNQKVAVFFTNDSDSLWTNAEWVEAIRHKMINLSSNYNTVLLFNSEHHTPNVNNSGMNYPQRFDKYMVCGYWVFPNGSTKFCYGGQKSDGNFKVCK